MSGKELVSVFSIAAALLLMMNHHLTMASLLKLYPLESLNLGHFSPNFVIVCGGESKILGTLLFLFCVLDMNLLQLKTLFSLTIQVILYSFPKILLNDIRSLINWLFLFL